MPNLNLLDVDGTVVQEAYQLISQYRLNPRDAIHAASAIVNGITDMHSDDPDFDRIKAIKRNPV